MKKYIVIKLLKLLDYFLDTDKDNQPVVIFNGDGTITYYNSNTKIIIK